LYASEEEYVLSRFARRGVANAKTPWWLLLALCVGCSSSLDLSLENKTCSGSGACLPGYVCSPERICVREAEPVQREPDAGMERHDAAAPDASPVDPPIMQPPAAGMSGGPGAGAGGETQVMTGTAGAASGAAGGAGEPVPACPSPAALCDGRCVVLDTDPEHCGACGRLCQAPALGAARCAQGACAAVCPAPLLLCDGRCIDAASDVAHCGGCGKVCLAAVGGEAVCTRGGCGLACSAGLDACSGACVKLADDRNHCGACDTACPAQQMCVQGVCTAPEPEEPPGVNVVELRRLLAQYGITLEQFASLLGMRVDELPGAHITVTDLARVGLTRARLQQLGITRAELERAGIDVSVGW
jgi:Stigma-specific protein, Stig1